MYPAAVRHGLALDNRTARARVGAMEDDVSEHVLFDWFVDHLPDFDPAWPAEIQAAWMECFMRLWRWGCRIDKED